MHQLGEDDHILAESLEDKGQHDCEEDVEQQRGLHASLPQSLLHLKLIRTDAIIRSHTSSHPIVELLNDCSEGLDGFRFFFKHSLRTHTSVLLYSHTVHYPGDISIRLGRMDASRQNSNTTDARSMLYRETEAMLYQALRGVQRQLL